MIFFITERTKTLIFYKETLEMYTPNSHHHLELARNGTHDVSFIVYTTATPGAHQHLELARDRCNELRATADRERLAHQATANTPGLWRQLRRRVGDVLIGLGRRIRGSEPAPLMGPRTGSASFC
jgi:hypothetical protein